MLEYLFIGGGFAFAAALQPGPLQAFLLSSVAQRGWQRTLPACLAPLISDGPIILLTLLVLNHIPDGFRIALRVAGGAFLIYLAWVSYRRWKHPLALDAEDGGSTPRTLMQATMVNLLNPNPYLAWSLVMGPALLAAWQRGPLNALALVGAFYGVMVLMLAFTIFLLGTTRFLGAGGRRVLLLVSAVTLAALGVYQLILSVMRA